MKIIDNLNFEKASILLEGFNQSTNLVTAIIDLDGNVLFKSKWRRICSDFHRKNNCSFKNCKISDTDLANSIKDGEKYHFCKCNNGMIDVCAPIIIRGEHIANLFSGQLFFEEPDITFFKNQAKKYGFEEISYLEALREVPIISEVKVEKAMNFLINLIEMFFEMTADKLDQLALNEDIKKSEVDLLESQRQLNNNVYNLIESQRIAHLGTWKLDFETSQVEWSDELYKIFDLDKRTPLPLYRDQSGLFNHESWNILMDCIEQTRITGVPFELELESINKDGTNGWIWVSGEAVRDVNENIIGIRGATQNITDRVNSKRVLKESEERYKLIAENTGDVISVYNLNKNQFTYISPSIFTLRGFTVEEALKESLEDAIAFSCIDYDKLVKQNNPKKYNVFVDEVLQKCKNGVFIWVEISTKYNYNIEGDLVAISVSRNIDKRKKAEATMMHLSYYDQLTNLYNRRFYEEELKRLDTKRNLPLSLIMSDVNGLKLVNDTLGHQEGDILLQKIADILKKVCRDDEIISRIGGDEFVILIPKCNSIQAKILTERINNILLIEKEKDSKISLALGYATKEKTSQSMEDIFKKAEDSMYRHKITQRI
jgi:diguanylate cyclase (GGDEF)-like protein/PAS domain S-box-containing protein